MSIQKKLFVVLLSATSLMMYAAFIFLNWSMDKGMLEYVNNREMAEQINLAEQLSSYYTRDNNWDFLRDNYPLWHQIRRAQHEFNGRRTEHSPPPPRGHANRPPPPPDSGSRRPPRLKMAVIDSQRLPVVGFIQAKLAVHETAIQVSDVAVGWLLTHRREQLTDQFDLKFIAQQREILLLVACLLVAIIALLTWILARHLLVPLKQLASATSLLTQGHYSLKLNSKRSDELGQLQRDFNELAKTLAANEITRTRWLADISHELRTPLSIIRAEIEAMQDGIRPMDTDALNSMADENKRISKLVDDLHELSNAELGALRYRKQWVDFEQVLSNAVARHRVAFETAQLELTIEIPDSSVEAYIDENRINQLIDNLLTNSIKYTNAGGKVNVKLENKPQHIMITIEDSAPAVSEHDMSHLCDYLFRVDNSRNRATGGSGLGLAICQRIIEAHHGNMRISASTLGGLCVDIVLKKQSET